MQVYVSGALHSISNISEARAFYTSLANVCIKHGWDAYVPHQYTDPVYHRDSSNGVVFEKDYNALRNSQMVLAYIGRPSLGVGAELAIAHEAGIPIIAVHAHNESPSRFLLGMLQRAPAARILVYKDVEECLRLLHRLFEQEFSQDHISQPKLHQTK